MPTVLIGGGSGMIGTRLSQLLSDQGYTVWHLSRTRDPDAPYPTYVWDVQKDHIDQNAVDEADYIINLAGAGIADKRWTVQRKKLIIDSRVNTTELLRKAIEKSNRKPRAFISSSALGYYGHRGDQLMTEEDPPGEGFLPESVLAWENAADRLESLGVRTVVIRTGIVLSTHGGALPKMTIPIHFFAGVYFGDGRQWLSWIHIDDVCRLFIYALENDTLTGVFNGVAPNPERNRAFIAQVAEVKGKPVIMIPAPAPILKLIFGEMSHTILDSTRASSQKVESAGFTFKFPDLKQAVADLIERKV